MSLPRSICASLSVLFCLGAGDPLLAAAPASPMALAQSMLGAAPAASAKPDAPAAPRLESQLAEAQQALDQLRALGPAPRLPDGVSPTDALLKQALLERLVSSYSGRLSLRGESERSAKDLAQAQADLKDWSGFAQAAPYPLHQAEQLHQQLRSAQAELEAMQSLQKLLSQSQDNTRLALKSDEVRLRQATEREEGAATPPQRDAAQWRLEQARWSRDLDASELLAFDDIGQVLQNREATWKARSDLWQQQLDQIGGRIAFSSADLQQVQDGLKTEQQQLSRRLNGVEQQKQQIGTRLQQLEQQTAKGGEAATPDSAAQDRLGEQRLALDNSELAARLLRLQLGLNAQSSTLWNYRYQIYSHQASEEKVFSADNQSALKELDGLQDYLHKEVLLTVAHLGDLQPLRSGDMAAGFGHLLQMRQLYRERLNALYAAQEATEAVISNLHLLQAEIAASQPAAGSLPRELGHTLRQRLVEAFWGVWNFELFSADDSVDVNGQHIVATRSVTIGKSVGAILVLLAGYALGSALLRRLRRIVVRFLRVSDARATLWWRWGHIFWLALLVIFAMNLVKIPLTIFAFMGGALAIGIGFGAQNLLKNLISGLMLLVERSLKVGDYVQVSGISGTVTSIGLRSCVVRAADGIETLIPNATFVESAVTNWTYSSNRIRRSIAIGVAYGTPTREVSRILLDQARAHPQVLPEPAPRVLFCDFGPDALQFELEYWLDMVQADSRLVGSELRHAIEHALGQAGITIPSPQRELHLAQEQAFKVEIQRP